MIKAFIEQNYQKNNLVVCIANYVTVNQRTIETMKTAIGYDIENAVKNAKVYISKAIAKSLNLGFGNCPLNHL